MGNNKFENLIRILIVNISLDFKIHINLVFGHGKQTKRAQMKNNALGSKHKLF